MRKNGRGLAERGGAHGLRLVGSRLLRVWGLRGSGLLPSALLPPRSSSLSATFQKLWTSALSRRRALARLGNTVWLPSPGQTTRSWWVLDPSSGLRKGGYRNGS